MAMTSNFPPRKTVAKAGKKDTETNKQKWVEGKDAVKTRGRSLRRVRRLQLSALKSKKSV